MTDYYSSPWASVPNGGAKYRLHLKVVLASQSATENTSTVNWELWIEKDRSYQGFYDYPATVAASVDGSVLSSTTAHPTAPWTGWAAHKLGSGSKTITHGADGKKAPIAVSASWTRAANGWAPGNMTVSGTFALPDLQRSLNPTVTPQTSAVGRTVTISTPRANSAYKHRITWTAGSLSGTIASAADTSTNWTVPNVFTAFPGETKVGVAIKVETLSGSTVVGTKQITLVVLNAAPPPVQPRTPGDGKDFDIRARVVTWDGTNWARGRILPTQEIQVVEPHSATSTCTITLSRLVAQDFADYSVIDIDVFDGDNWVFTDLRFVLTRVEDDGADPTETVTYSGTSFIDFMLASAYTMEDHEYEQATTPGSIMHDMLIGAKGRGWGPRVQAGFTREQATLQEAWANKPEGRTISKGTPFSQILQGFVDDGLVEYRGHYVGNTAYLHMFNPGTGQNLGTVGGTGLSGWPVSVNLGTIKLDRAPRRSTMEGRLTRVTVVGEEDLKVTRERAPLDTTVFGHLEGWVQASGVKKGDEAKAIGDASLDMAAAPTDERTFEYSPIGLVRAYFPFVSFIPGDWIAVPENRGIGGISVERVAQVTVSKSADSLSVSVTTGDRILSGTASIAKRTKAQTGGSIAAGSQTNLNQIDGRIPAAPNAVTSTTEGYWAEDGAPRAWVEVTWQSVNLSIAQTAIDVNFYEVWTRPANQDDQWELATGVTDTKARITGFQIDTAREFRVRARSKAGVYGEFSENILVTTVAPTATPAAPTAPTLEADQIGTIRATWNGLIAGAVPPIWFAYLRAEISDSAAGAYMPAGQQLTASGDIVISGVGEGTWWVRLVGYDTLNRRGTASPAMSVEVVPVEVDTRQPKAPTGVIVGSSGYWDGASAMSSITVTWDAVTQATDNSPINIRLYEVWARRAGDVQYHQLTDVAGTTTAVTIAPMGPVGQDFDIVVLAVAENNERSDFSVSETVTLVAPDQTIDPPTTPNVNSERGLVEVEWDGNLEFDGGDDPVLMLKNRVGNPDTISGGSTFNASNGTGTYTPRDDATGKVARKNWFPYSEPRAYYSQYMERWAGTSNVGTDIIPVEVAWSESGKAIEWGYSTVVNPNSGGIRIRAKLDGNVFVPLGEKWTMVYKIRVSEATTLGYIGMSVTSGTIHARSHDSTISVAAGEVVKVWITFTYFAAPASNSGMSVTINGKTTTMRVQVADIDMYPGDYQPDRPWFSGNSENDEDWTYEWTGTVGMSASVQKYARGIKPILSAVARRNDAVDPLALSYGPASPANTARWQNDRWAAKGTYSLVAGASDGPNTPNGKIGSYARFTLNVSEGSTYGFHLAGNTDLATTAAGIPVTPGETITVSLYMRRTGDSGNIRLSGKFTDGANSVGSVIHETLSGVASGVWARLAMTLTAPSGAARLLLTATAQVSIAGATIDGTGLLVERSAVLGDFFCGSTLDGDLRIGQSVYDWEGAANGSSSIQRVYIEGGYHRHTSNAGGTQLTQPNAPSGEGSGTRFSVSEGQALAMRAKVQNPNAHDIYVKGRFTPFVGSTPTGLVIYGDTVLIPAFGTAVVEAFSTVPAGIDHVAAGVGTANASGANFTPASGTLLDTTEWAFYSGADVANVGSPIRYVSGNLPATDLDIYEWVNEAAPNASPSLWYFDHDGPSRVYPIPNYISHVDIQLSADEGATWESVGFLTRGARVQTVGGVQVGTNVRVRLVPYTVLGVAGQQSPYASTLVVGITGPDIEANAINSNHITAGSIQVSHVSPSFGEDLNLSANGSITLIAGQAASAASAAAAAASDVANFRTRYDFTPTEAVISQPGSVFQVAISNTQMEFRESGIARAWLNAGVFNAPQLSTVSLLFPNHLVLDENGGTAIKRVGS